MTDLNLTWPDETHTAAFAHHLADLFTAALQQGGRVHMELRGDLGAGKTTFTRHVLRHMGVTGRVKSPSYAVMEPYEANGLAIWHFDFYRFEDPREWEDAGFRDIFDTPGLTIVEWPDKAGGLLPPADVCLQLSTLADESRQAHLAGHTAQWQAWQTALA